MRRVLAVLALTLLPVIASAQDTLDDTDSALTGEGVVEATGEQGGRPACGCNGAGASAGVPLLGLAALAARRRRS